MSESIARRSDSRRPLAEIAAVVVFVLAAEWMVPPLFGRNLFAEAVPVALVFAIIFSSHLRTKESPRDLGWRIDNFAAAAVVLAPLIVAAAGFLFALSWITGNLPSVGTAALNLPLVWTFLGLIAWGLVQEYPLQGFINRRLQGVMGAGSLSATVTALIFAVLHLPNPWLTAGTFLGGLLISYAYQRVPNLLAAGLAHAILTVILVLTVPYPMLHGLRVGYYFFH